MVGVAQLVERRSVAPNVAGSIPVSHPNPSQLKTKPFPIFPCSGDGRFFAQSLHNGLRGPPAGSILVCSPLKEHRTKFFVRKLWTREKDWDSVLIEVKSKFKPLPGQGGC